MIDTTQEDRKNPLSTTHPVWTNKLSIKHGVLARPSDDGMPVGGVCMLVLSSPHAYDPKNKKLKQEIKDLGFDIKTLQPSSITISKESNPIYDPFGYIAAIIQLEQASQKNTCLLYIQTLKPKHKRPEEQTKFIEHVMGTRAMYRQDAQRFGCTKPALLGILTEYYVATLASAVAVPSCTTVVTSFHWASKYFAATKATDSANVSLWAKCTLDAIHLAYERLNSMKFTSQPTLQLCVEDKPISLALTQSIRPSVANHTMSSVHNTQGKDTITLSDLRPPIVSRQSTNLLHKTPSQEIATQAQRIILPLPVPAIKDSSSTQAQNSQAISPSPSPKRVRNQKEEPLTPSHDTERRGNISTSGWEEKALKTPRTLDTKQSLELEQSHIPKTFSKKEVTQKRKSCDVSKKPRGEYLARVTPTVVGSPSSSPRPFSYTGNRDAIEGMPNPVDQKGTASHKSRASKHTRCYTDLGTNALIKELNAALREGEKPDIPVECKGSMLSAAPFPQSDNDTVSRNPPVDMSRNPVSRRSSAKNTQIRTRDAGVPQNTFQYPS
jgi:hypothetical protein